MRKVLSIQMSYQSRLVFIVALSCGAWLIPAPRPTAQIQAFENSLGMQLVSIPPLAVTSRERAFPGSRPFYIAEYEVSIGQFREFCKATGYRTTAERTRIAAGGLNHATGELERQEEFDWRNTGFEQPDDHPVVNVTWSDAEEFCRWLSVREGRTYRLPTQAEWVYCCRAGSTSLYSFGDDVREIADFGNVIDTSADAALGFNSAANLHNDSHPFTAPVGSFRPNPWGLYDLHGNVWEWCKDDVDRPEFKRLKGGSWNSEGRSAAVSHVNALAFDDCDLDVGFRVVCEVSRRPMYKSKPQERHANRL